ncbi:branched-chain amino acid transport system II carrier protein [Dentiradicibacter hellwigii]|uniref:Branched-chain amino acid transport system carrier protein n=1 Tax=Dentiradicibacter hellwigii TaxID=3149053 RepID=A0ABV4UDK6_9RHOO
MHTHRSIFVATGLMLFALFFGAGNLIFPALMGQQAGDHIFAAMSGFLLTGAGLPLLGVIAVGYSGSRDVQDLASRVTPWYGTLFAVMLYLAIGPLFAIPRTATVSFEIGVAPFLGELDEYGKRLYLAAFCLLFFGASYWLSISPGKLVDRIGKVLTPALLLTIAILVITAAIKPMAAPQAPQAASGYDTHALTQGIIAGYETMDALASLVFAIIVISSVRSKGVSDKRQMLSLTMRAGCVAALCLSVVYVFIAYMGATSVGGIGLQQNGAAVLSKSAEHYFGNAGKILLAVIVFLACLSTAVGLITSCSGYFNRLLPRCAYRTWAILFTLVSCGLANVGLNTIIKLSVPALMLLYPLTIALIALALLHNFFGGGRIVYICTMLATGTVALFDGWKAFSGVEHGLPMRLHALFGDYLPLYASGLGWVVPALIGFGIGMTIKILQRPRPAIDSTPS